MNSFERRTGGCFRRTGGCFRLCIFVFSPYAMTYRMSHDFFAMYKTLGNGFDKAGTFVT